MTENRRVPFSTLNEWLETTDQFDYGRTKDGMPKQLRANRRGDFFIFVNGRFRRYSRDARTILDAYNEL